VKHALALVVAMTSLATAEPGARLHAEVDPLPFARGGYGGQIGVRVDRIARVRVAVASFSLDVPDLVTQLGGNDDFHLRVRPSGALYVLYYLSPGRSGLAVGGSVRYLRLRYTHDAVPGMEAETSEVSPEAIVGYKWHPTRHGFYLQPWLGASITAWRSGEPVVGDRTYAPLPVQLFFTVNLGWEL
jgi:hypothetical protein